MTKDDHVGQVRPAGPGFAWACSCGEESHHMYSSNPKGIFETRVEAAKDWSRHGGALPRTEDKGTKALLRDKRGRRKWLRRKFDRGLQEAVKDAYQSEEELQWPNR